MTDPNYLKSKPRKVARLRKIHTKIIDSTSNQYKKVIIAGRLLKWGKRSKRNQGNKYNSIIVLSSLKLSII